MRLKLPIGVALAVVSVATSATALDLKQDTLRAYIADCDRFGISLCESRFGNRVLERWSRHHSSDTIAPCTVGPGDASPTKTQIGTPIWHWLNEHPELGKTNAYKAFVSAEHAVYPCIDS